MKIDEFIEKFAEQFDDQPNGLNASTNFREVEGWCSIVGLSVIAMVDEEYDVQLSGDDIRSSNTIEDIFNKVVAKKS